MIGFELVDYMTHTLSESRTSTYGTLLDPTETIYFLAYPSTMMPRCLKATYENVSC